MIPDAPPSVQAIYASSQASFTTCTSSQRLTKHTRGTPSQSPLWSDFATCTSCTTDAYARRRPTSSRPRAGTTSATCSPSAGRAVTRCRHRTRSTRPGYACTRTTGYALVGVAAHQQQQEAKEANGFLREVIGESARQINQLRKLLARCRSSRWHTRSSQRFLADASERQSLGPETWQHTQDVQRGSFTADDFPWTPADPSYPTIYNTQHDLAIQRAVGYNRGFETGPSDPPPLYSGQR